MNENKMGRCAVTVCDNYALVENVVEMPGHGSQPPLRVYLCVPCYEAYVKSLEMPYPGSPRESISPQQFKREMYGDWPGFSSDPAEPPDDGAEEEGLSKHDAEKYAGRLLEKYANWPPPPIWESTVLEDSAEPYTIAESDEIQQRIERAVRNAGWSNRVVERRNDE